MPHTHEHMPEASIETPTVSPEQMERAKFLFKSIVEDLNPHSFTFEDIAGNFNADAEVGEWKVEGGRQEAVHYTKNHLKVLEGLGLIHRDPENQTYHIDDRLDARSIGNEEIDALFDVEGYDLPKWSEEIE